jgi:transposase
MFTTVNLDGKPERVELITGVLRRRRWTSSEKLVLVQETYQAGKIVSLVAREAGITASQLFQWRKAYSGLPRLSWTTPG